MAFRPYISSAHATHFKTFLAYLIFMDLPLQMNLHKILTFIEYLHSNTLSAKVISNYVSSLSVMAQRYSIKHEALKDSCVTRLLRSISINSIFSPTPCGIFDIKTLFSFSISCRPDLCSPMGPSTIKMDRDIAI